MDDQNPQGDKSPNDPFGNPFAARPAGYGYRGPERRSPTSLASRWAAMMLDQIDYGMLLLVDRATVVHVNRTARAELDAGHPLQLLGSELRARNPQDVARLHDALGGALRGLRKMVTLGGPEQSVAVAVVPLGDLGGMAMMAGAAGSIDVSRATLLTMEKRRVCEDLSVQWFARSHGLTPAETRVLEALCNGRDARDIAADHGVGMATVRAQIGAIRAKTGADSIRDVLRRVAVLPPMVGALKLAA